MLGIDEKFIPLSVKTLFKRDLIKIKKNFSFDVDNFCETCHDYLLKWILLLEKLDFFYLEFDEEILSNTEEWKDGIMRVNKSDWKVNSQLSILCQHMFSIVGHNANDESLFSLKNISGQKNEIRDFPGRPVVKTSPCNSGGAGSILGRGAMIPHALQPKKPETEAIL